MAIEVFNNTSAFNVFSNLTNNVGMMKKSMSRLSSGQRAVVDDPSGVGISERMRSQIRSSEMARHNVDNGISLLQTSDAWLQKINDMLGRMHELSVESEDGTKTATDQTNIQSEFSELQDEIARVTSKSTAVYCPASKNPSGSIGQDALVRVDTEYRLRSSGPSA